MINGYIRDGREALIRISIQNGKGEFVAIDAVIDTGFNGSLTLPAAIITSLELRWRGKGTALMANGAIDQCDIYAANVLWDGAGRNILVEAADTDPLIGTAMMSGHELRVQFLSGGEVRLREIQS